MKVVEYPPAVLLDTCAVIWLANGDPISREARRAIDRASGADGVLISVVSAWEVGLLSQRTGDRALRFVPDAKTWFANVMAGPAIRAAPFTAEIAIDASLLPGPLHGDPADRMLIATARHLRLPIVTRDERIRAYSKTGQVEVIAC